MRTYLLFLLTFLTLSSTLSGQVRERREARLGASGEEGCYSATPAPDGGFLLAGSSQSGVDGSKFTPSRGGYDFWVVKLDAGGEVQWDRAYGGRADEELWTVLAVDAGGYILGGCSYSGQGCDKTEASRGGADFWVVRIDLNGNILWDRTFGGTGDDWLYAIQPAPGGGFLLGGATLSLQGGDRTEPLRGGRDYWVVRIDAFGNKLWDKRYGGPSDDYLQCMLALPGGGFLLGGHSFSGAGGDKTEPSRGGYDYWLLEVDASGNKVWDKRYGGHLDEYCYGLLFTPDGEYLLAGYSYSGIYGDKTQPSRGGSDFWLLRLNDRGGKVWEEVYGGPGDERLYSMAVATDGRYLLAGDSDSGPGGEKTEPSRGGFDGWMIEVDADGAIYWDKTMGGPGADYFVPAFQIKGGAFMAAGGTQSGGNGVWDFWVAQATANCAEVALSIRADVSPASCPDLADGSLSVRVSGGTGPYTYTWSDGDTASMLEELAAGVYSLTVEEAGGCKASQSFEIGIQPGPLGAHISPCQTVFSGYESNWQCAALELRVEGGCGPYTYRWSTGDTVADIQVCPEETGFYFVTVVDQAGQSLVLSAEVEVLDIRCGSNLDKVLMCQTPHNNPDLVRTICVPAASVKDYLAAGGYLGPCGWKSCAGYSLALAISDGELDPELVLGRATGFEEPAMQPTLYLFPNPAGDYITADLRYFPNGTYGITIFDRQGAPLISKVLEVDDATQWQADLSGYPTGLYWIQVRSDTVVVEQKFIVGNLISQ